MRTPTVPQNQSTRGNQVKRDLMTKSIFDYIKQGANNQKQYSKDKKYEIKNSVLSDDFFNTNVAEPIWKYTSEK